MAATTARVVTTVMDLRVGMRTTVSDDDGGGGKI